jgi:uncharacterized protein (DUF2141 family)
MRHAFFLCIRLGLALFSIASVTLGQESAHLRVRVVSSDSPVIGATVSLSSPFISSNAAGEYQKYTNDAGECEFTQLSGGSYSLRVSKPSFIPQSEAGIAKLEVVIRAGETRVVQSYLIKGGVVSGRLLNADNDGLTGIPVTVLWVDSANPRHYQLPAASESNATSVSDDRGVFRIYGLRPGNYVIAVNAKLDASLRKDILPLKYLGGSDSNASGGVFVGYSEEIKLPDIQLTANAAEACALSGTVKGKENLPLGSALVSLVGVDDQTLSDKGVTNEAGEFGFEGLTPGKYRISASSKQGPYRSFMKEIYLGTPTTNLAINLLEYPAIEGRTFLYRNEKPDPFPLLKIALTPVEGGASLDFTSATDGAFSVRTPRTGYFSWSLPGLARNQYLAAVKLGDKDITSSPMLIGDKSIADLAVYVSPGAATVSGRFPESAASGCKEFTVYAVLLSPKDDEVLRWKPASECTGDSFSIYSLTPGNYYLVALPLKGLAEAQSPDETLRAALKASKLSRSDVFFVDRNHPASRQPVFLQPLTGVRR